MDSKTYNRQHKLHIKIMRHTQDNVREETKLMDKLMLIPKKEEYDPNGDIPYYANFRIGMFNVEFNVVSVKSMKLSRSHKSYIAEKYPELSRDWICIMTIGKNGWCWKSSNDIEECRVSFKDIVTRLKYGDSIEFKDMSKKSVPIRVSFRGLEFEW